MKKLMLGALVVIGIALAILGVGSVSQSAPNISYVYSGSMEPVIHTGDGFIVIPVSQIKIGDIVLYRPLKLEAALITHRIISIDSNGYGTKGDASPSSDQEAGEPLVTSDRIIGKVLVLNGSVFTISKLGLFVSGLQELIGSNTALVSSTLISSGVMIILWNLLFPKKKRKSRRRWRLRDVYQGAAILISGILVLSILMGSSMQTVNYLVSDSPGTDGLQVTTNQAGEVIGTVKNSSLFPVANYVSGILPLKTTLKSEIISPFSSRTFMISVDPQKDIGWFQGYVRVYNIPTVLPLKVLDVLFQMSPYIALGAVAIASYLWLLLIIKIFEYLFKVESWIPLHALKDKALFRRVNIFLNSMFGRRRSRS
jgi:signal peptidase